MIKDFRTDKSLSVLAQNVPDFVLKHPKIASVIESISEPTEDEIYADPVNKLFPITSPLKARLSMEYLLHQRHEMSEIEFMQLLGVISKASLLHGNDSEYPLKREEEEVTREIIYGLPSIQRFPLTSVYDVHVLYDSLEDLLPHLPKELKHELLVNINKISNIFSVDVPNIVKLYQSSITTSDTLMKCIDLIQEILPLVNHKYKERYKVLLSSVINGGGMPISRFVENVGALNNTAKITSREYPLGSKAISLLDFVPTPVIEESEEQIEYITSLPDSVKKVVIHNMSI